MVSPSRCPPWQPERPGPTRREPRRAQRSYTTRRDTIFKFPDPCINVPVRVLNFPVMFCREFTGKPLVSSGLPPITGPNSPIFVKIPCIFPDYQGIGVETGSQQTAPTASHPGEAVSSSHSSAKLRETARFAVKRNSELLNPGAFPAIAGLRGVRSPRARCKGEFGGNREFLRFQTSKQGEYSEIPNQ